MDARARPPAQQPPASRSNRRRTIWTTAVVVVLVNVALGALSVTSVLGDGVVSRLASGSPFLTLVAAAVLAVPARTRLLSEGFLRGGVAVIALGLLGPFLLMPVLALFGQ